MLKVIAEESDDFFSLLVRIQKMDKLQTKDKVHLGISESACIEVAHIQNQFYSKISLKQVTNRVDLTHPVWMEDIVYQAVHPTDQLVFSLINEHYSLVAFQKLPLQELHPFLNTGELETRRLTLQSEQGITAELSVSFSLFQPKQPMSGIFLLDLSLSTSNESWKSQYQAQINAVEPQRQKLCPWLNCDQIEQFTQLPFMKRGKKQQEK